MREKFKYPKEWKLLSIASLADNSKDLFDDGDWIEAEYLTDSGIRLIQTGNVGEGIFVDKEKRKYISEESYTKLKCKELIEGDILICRLADPAGRACILPNIGEEKMITSVDVSIYRPKLDFADRAFLVASMNTPNWFNEIRERCGGSTRTRIARSELGKMKIPLPPLPEQKAIAQVLSTADAAIHTTEKLIVQKELRKKWLMQQLLTGKKRLKGFDGEWKEKKLSDLFDRVTRKNTEGNTTVVTISAQRGFVRQTDFFNKNIASEITDNYFLVERGEFCYNKSYSNGYPWGATKRLNDFDNAVVTTLYICFGVKDEKKTNPEFFEQYFGANHLDKGLTKIAHEGGRAHGLLNVTPSDFFSLKVTVPSYEEQTAIAQVLQAADKEISLLKAKAEKLREQKKGLMQVLLTGKVRLKIIDTNERIK
jgi:type I restriction enzyme S subunit